jgi:putative membrane protein
VNLPLLNAWLNGSSAVLMCSGLVAIKSGKRELHAQLMKAAFVVSSTFLVSYVYYHFVVQPVLGPTLFRREGWIHTAYFAMLASHVLLAIVNLPLVIRVLWLAHKERWSAHKRLAKVTFPIWLYVSVTGVLVYLALYVWNPPPLQ